MSRNVGLPLVFRAKYVRTTGPQTEASWPAKVPAISQGMGVGSAGVAVAVSVGVALAVGVMLEVGVADAVGAVVKVAVGVGLAVAVGGLVAVGVGDAGVGVGRTAAAVGSAGGSAAGRPAHPTSRMDMNSKGQNLRTAVCPW